MMLTTAQLAKRLRISPQRVRQLEGFNGVAPVRMGRMLLWPDDAGERLAKARRRKPGRPKKQ